MLDMKLTIYSHNFDNGENVVNNGFNGNVFVEADDGKSGTPFNRCDEDNLAEALRYMVVNECKLSEIVYNFKDDGVQKYIKLRISDESPLECPVV